MTRWSTASIRVRLTGWYSVVLALMLVAYASVTFLAVRHEFYEQFDDQLHDDFETAEGRLMAAHDGRVVAVGDRRHDVDAEDRGTEVWAANGELTYRTDAAPALPPIVPAAASLTYRFESIETGGHRWRTLTGVTMTGGRSVVLRVSRSEDRLRAQLREIMVVLALGLPLIVALAAVGGYALARRALEPIDHLSSEARRITADRLHDRLSVPNEHDEIGRLAAVINDTFGRLEGSFDQLRRFTADASHELRTPLAVIRGTGELALSEARTLDELKDAMGSVLEEVDRLTKLVDTLLRLSHGDAGTVRVSPEQVDLGQLARDVVASLGILADDRGQRIVVDGPDGVLVTADRLVVREAIANVIDNAIKYSPRGSTITVRVARERSEAVLTVADQGPGIPAEHRDRIFDRFFRIDEARSRECGGTGLGLAIAKWAVAVNGGRITVEDAPGRGAAFRISMPAILQVACALSGAMLAMQIASAQQPLTLTTSIELPGVQGRIDHLAFDAAGQRLFVAALGNNTVEVLDVKGGKHLRSVPGFRTPQGIAAVPDARAIAVANGGGDGVQFVGDDYRMVRSVRLGDDSDNVRYDEATRIVYVGFGSGAIAAISPADARLQGQARLAGHPESFQLERSGSRIFVNVPDADHIAVIDRGSMRVIATWPVTTAGANFPMALDEANHRLIVGCRRPARALVFDTTSGKELAAFDIVGDTDDLFYDARRKRLYVSGGEGFIDVFQGDDANRFTRMARVPTAAGARTSLFVPDLDRFFLAVPRRGNQRAEIRVFNAG